MRLIVIIFMCLLVIGCEGTDESRDGVEENPKEVSAETTEETADRDDSNMYELLIEKWADDYAGILSVLEIEITKPGDYLADVSIGLKSESSIESEEIATLTSDLAANFKFYEELTGINVYWFDGSDEMIADYIIVRTGGELRVIK